MPQSLTGQRFQEMEQLLRRDSSRLAGIRVTYQFQIHGAADGLWYLRISDGEASVGEGRAPNPDMTCILSEEDFHAMAKGKVTGRDLFFSGRMGIEGNAMLGMLLGQLLNSS
jgi:putative sterol carrier protein